MITLNFGSMVSIIFFLQLLYICFIKESMDISINQYVSRDMENSTQFYIVKMPIYKQSYVILF